MSILKHPHYAVWMGDHWLPTLHYARMAESTFTSGEAYRLGVLEEKEKKTARRTKEQNDKMWAMLTDVALQKEHCGLRLTEDKWKVLFMEMLGHECEVLPSLDKKRLVAYGGRSSHLTIEKMTELIEYMYAWGAQHEVKFRDQEELTWTKTTPR